MTKAIFALAAAGILGAAMIPSGAQAMGPGKTAEVTGTQTEMTGTKTSALSSRLARERAQLRRDVRLGRTTQAAKLRREINADERSISRAKAGGQETPTARSMQPTQPGTQPSQMTKPQNQSNGTTGSSPTLPSENK
jgi:hypothetical protein